MTSPKPKPSCWTKTHCCFGRHHSAMLFVRHWLSFTGTPLYTSGMLSKAALAPLHSGQNRKHVCYRGFRRRLHPHRPGCVQRGVCSNREEIDIDCENRLRHA